MNDIKILQFGEGNFLRAFIDWMMTDDCIAVVKPRPGKGLERLLSTGCRYDVRLQGLDNGQAIDVTETIRSIQTAINPYEDHDAYLRLAECETLRFVVSNTTEAGIQFDPACQLSDTPALSYPGKLTQLLYHRWQHFNGSADKGLIILPCELIFHNGRALRQCILQYIELWQLPDAFRTWVETACPIYNTLVDRIVPGGDQPNTVMAEPYHLWVIEAPEALKQELPLRRDDLNIVFTDNEEPYHQRKVVMLNGLHTAMSAVGHLAGLESVRECILHPIVGKYVDRVMNEELLPTVPLPTAEVAAFAASVKERFLNPSIHHLLTSIMLNNISKYRTRDLPSLKWHLDHSSKLPMGLTIALAANLLCAELDATSLSDKSLWNEDLTLIDGLQATVQSLVSDIRSKGILEIVSSYLAS